MSIFKIRERFHGNYIHIATREMCELRIIIRESVKIKLFLIICKGETNNYFILQYTFLFKDINGRIEKKFYYRARKSIIIYLLSNLNIQFLETKTTFVK